MSDALNAAAVVFGVTGQSGSYLSEYLISIGYKVVGVTRRTSTVNDERIRHLYDHKNFSTVYGDITDSTSVERILMTNKPKEIYNLAAMSHVKISFDEPVHTTNATYIGCLNILEWIRSWHSRFDCSQEFPKFYQASSSEMFGTCFTIRHGDDPNNRRDFTPFSNDCFDGKPCQDERTPMIPCSPYAIAKLAAHHAVRLYRDSYGLFVCSGILMNHESPRRGVEFVTRKITQYVATWVKAREQGKVIPPLRLGNLDAKRDWGHARDYVRAMHLMLQKDMADDFVVATGETHSVKEFLFKAFEAVGVYTEKLEDLPVVIDHNLYRPCEVPYLRGDASKARQQLGWNPTITFDELVKEMVSADLAIAGVSHSGIDAIKP